jgi:hypothetical protein
MIWYLDIAHSSLKEEKMERDITLKTKLFDNSRERRELIHAEGLFRPNRRLYGNAAGAKGDASRITGDISGIEGNVSELSDDVTHVVGNVSGISGSMSGIEGNLTGLKCTAEEIRTILKKLRLLPRKKHSPLSC